MFPNNTVDDITQRIEDIRVKNGGTLTLRVHEDFKPNAIPQRKAEANFSPVPT